ncbi:glycoside hydrolase family 31 protein [Paenibacillus sp. PAMC21692]|uniref:glycoside hydrolase family 31 protein n=1 Tax=Paenibacillus sp. PAMC21692 TaxID=2762320 RepID=UPI00164DA33C|nr:glycoside hydrolase family 31 protein [Paenibacillus sp. PAMC21692]QNK57247.1 glycoside hydrolase [Paenibacillus sp. PAMC21692]
MENQELRIRLLEGEVWWGGDITYGNEMPFGRETIEVDLTVRIRSNQAAPLLVSNKGRYVWADKPIRFRFEGGLLTVYCESGEPILRELGGTLRQALRSAAAEHFPPTGKLPDKRFFTVPQYNLWIELQYEPTQEKTLRYAEAVLANGLPPGVIMIDDNWMEDYGVWRFRTDRFPDPKAMTDRLHELGFQVMLWTCPFVSPDNAANFRSLENKGFLLRDERGETAIRRWWNGYSAVLDCTNSSAVEWYQRELQKLIDMYGIDGFKFDAGDPDYYRESDQSATPMHPNGHCEAWAAVGLGYTFNEYRACWKMGGQPLVQRLCDRQHSWDLDGLGSLIPNGLAQGLSGYAYICPDMIGGGQIGDVENNPSFRIDQELFVRYAQCSALFPMMQFSTAPWRVLDREHLAHCIEAAKLHAALGDTFLELAKHAAATGEPILRHMAYVFPEVGFEGIIDQFMVGDTLLAAPVVEKGARSRKIHFPAGEWLGDDGSKVFGPCVLEVNAPLSRLPHYRLINR